MKKTLNMKNRLVAILSMFLCVAICLGTVAIGNVSAATSFTREAPSFNNITHAGGTYTIAETDGVNIKFENETEELVYSKEIDITKFDGNQPFVKFYVKPIGARCISFYIDIIDCENPDNILSVQINSMDSGSTRDSSISACVPSIGQLYTGYWFGNPNNVRANSLYTGHRKYSNFAESDPVTNRTAYQSVHFSFDNNTNKIYTTIGDNAYSATNNKLVCELSDTERVIANYFLHDGTIDDKVSQTLTNKKGTFDVAWDGFEGSKVTVKMRVVGRNTSAAVTSSNPVEIYMATIGNELVDTSKLSFGTIVSKIDVIYNMGGGVNNDENPDQINSDEQITLKDATRTGYVFDGWYTSEDFAEASKVTVIPTDAGNEVTLYAKFIKVCNITYELNGGTNNADNKGSYTQGTEVILKDATKDGHTFAGWYTSSDFAEASKVTSITIGTEDITLYAKFTSNQSSSLGLWIGLGVGGAAIIVVAVLIVLKNKKKA